MVVKGKTEAVDVYELLEMHDGWGPPNIPEWVLTYERGLAAFLVRDFTKAIEYFNKANDLRPGGDSPSEVMVERCQAALHELSKERLIANLSAEKPQGQQTGVAELESPDAPAGDQGTITPEE